MEFVRLWKGQIIAVFVKLDGNLQVVIHALPTGIAQTKKRTLVNYQMSAAAHKMKQTPKDCAIIHN